MAGRAGSDARGAAHAGRAGSEIARAAMTGRAGRDARGTAYVGRTGSEIGCAAKAGCAAFVRRSAGNVRRPGSCLTLTARPVEIGERVRPRAATEQDQQRTGAEQKAIHRIHQRIVPFHYASQAKRSVFFALIRDLRA